MLDIHYYKFNICRTQSPAYGNASVHIPVLLHNHTEQRNEDDEHTTCCKEYVSRFMIVKLVILH